MKPIVGCAAELPPVIMPIAVCAVAIAAGGLVAPAPDGVGMPAMAKAVPGGPDTETREVTEGVGVTAKADAAVELRDAGTETELFGA